MKRTFVGMLLLLLSSTALAQFTPPGRPFAPPAPSPVLVLGESFGTLFVSCGTPINPTCPRALDPVGRPFLIHYIAAGGRSADVCSASVSVQRVTPEGVMTYLLLRLVFGPDTADNVTLPLARPVRVEATDVVMVAHAQGTCAIHATIGIEYLE
jgi:hypothetical protein